MVHSNSSPFHKKYRNHINPKDYKYFLKHETTTHERLDKADSTKEILDKQYWFNKEIFNLYLEKGNIRAVEKETNIPRSTLHKILEETKEKIKTQMNPIQVLLLVQPEMTALQYHRQIIDRKSVV